MIGCGDFTFYDSADFSVVVPDECDPVDFRRLPSAASDKGESFTVAFLSIAAPPEPNRSISG
jgi:hypothetical protein